MNVEKLLLRGVEEIIEKEHLEKVLKSGQKLRVKHGIDPTTSFLHLGHTVCLRKLRQFQDQGHKAILILGDFTARIGDPSLQDKTRPLLSKKEVEENTRNYLNQAKKILDLEKLEIKRNSEWFEKMSLEEFLKLESYFTVPRILERDDFEKRIKKGRDLRFHEIDYPILQAYDSVMIKADLEIGGTDQKFNLLAGRRLQQALGQKPQDILTMPILIGLDGKLKMSKTYGNYIGLEEKPEEMYGKIMSIPDDLIRPYFRLLTEIEMEKLKGHPKDQKARLAFEIVKIYHSRKAAKKAEKEFEKIFKKKGLPSKIPTYTLPLKSYNLADLLVKINLAPSKSEAKRLIEQGGVKIDKKVVRDKDLVIEIKKGMIIQVGRRKFVKIK